MNSIELAGIGMTSQRTRERLIQRLVDQGISSQPVLDVIRMTPRHIFSMRPYLIAPMRIQPCRSAFPRPFPSPISLPA